MELLFFKINVMHCKEAHTSGSSNYLKVGFSNPVTRLERIRSLRTWFPQDDQCLKTLFQALFLVPIYYCVEGDFFLPFKSTLRSCFIRVLLSEGRNFYLMNVRDARRCMVLLLCGTALLRGSSSKPGQQHRDSDEFLKEAIAV